MLIKNACIELRLFESDCIDLFDGYRQTRGEGATVQGPGLALNGPGCIEHQAIKIRKNTKYCDVTYCSYLTSVRKKAVVFCYASYFLALWLVILVLKVSLDFQHVCISTIPYKNVSKTIPGRCLKLQYLRRSHEILKGRFTVVCVLPCHNLP